MTEWRASTWGEEISLEYGKALRGYGNAAGKVPVYGTNGPVGWTDEPLAAGPGVILGRKGAYRGVHFSRIPFFVIDTAYYVVPKTELDMRWLYYAMIYHKLGEIDDGSPIPSTTRAAVYPRQLEVPGIDEQKAIAAVLGALDDKIELNRRMNETLETMARAIFRSWFVDFDPVRAKMKGRHTGLTADVAALFPDSFGHDGLPEGWVSGTLARLAATNPESWTGTYHPQVIEYVDLSNTKLGNIESTTLFDWEAAPSRARRVCKIGDTILGTTRPGNRSYAYISRCNLTVSTGFAVLSPYSAIYRDAVYLFATIPENIERLARLADGHGGAYLRPIAGQAHL